MANLSEIQERINSIKDTMKITNAMYMISTNKLRRAKQALENTEPYFNKLDDIIASVLTHAPHISHVIFGNLANLPQEKRRKGFVVITADKGMAGAYNHNVLKLAENIIKQPRRTYELYVIGQVGENYFRRRSYCIDETFHYTAQNPSLSRARKIGERLIDKYMDNELDEVYIVYTRMVSPTVMEPVVTRILPLSRDDYSADGEYATVPMFPSPEAVLSSVAPICVTGYIYSALVESYCCEQNSRVNAMQAATDAGSEMLHDLSVQFNRVRQAKITQEITEVVGGAKALKRKSK
ncbi:MAG TPA: ATP synthase F1 subunit gamma [Candidatus Ornithomonoglobus merdipullorum]|uniref:ATP synthase gamma chain n=1 Tax=Candidatus Ornithomonoglobus merdipullorum TaxID=2840895 RepID=A0A9D1SDM0_9FIRM|nr:ATP synthase F1 subunit gamma [Candidatus Ornithomonoglobus merdipullorum]